MTYYSLNRTRLLQKQKEYEQEKYNSDNEFKLIKRYQSRIDNHFINTKHKAEDLLSCSSKFFTTYIKFCLSDTNRARIDLGLIELHHVIPVITSPGDLNLWHWTNVLPVLEEENLHQGSNRDKDLEKNHKNRIMRFLLSVQIN